MKALHVIAAVVNRRAANFVTAPESLDLGRFQRCIAPKIAHLDLNLETAFHRYSDPPAVLTATFENRATVKAYVDREGVHATVNDSRGWVTSSGAFLALQIPYVHILPQIGPLQRDEKQLTDGYIDEHSCPN